jgi:hypothetical protein
VGIAGVGGQEVSTLPMVAAGRKAGTNVEDFFRGAQFRGLARQKYTDEAAAQIINKLHFDYSSVTPFERDVMRRVIPFYTFFSKNLPLQAQTLMQRPGLGLAQMYPGMQGRHDPNQFVPDYLSGNVSIPLGPGSEPGHQKYIGTLGLPLESAFAPLALKGGLPDLQRTAQQYLGNANPLIKYPLERIFNTQLFSGRKLSDLKSGQTLSTLGKLFGEENPQFLSQVVSNTPFSRFMSTADRVFDPRKAWYEKAINLTTGAHITDVDVEKQKAREAQAALGDLSALQPELASYTSWYPKAEYRGNLSPEAVERLRELATQQQQAEQFVKERNRRLAAQGQPLVGVRRP